MKTLYTLLILLGITVNAFSQQQGSITGTVTTSDGKKAEYVNVVVKGTAKGTMTNTEGHFTIHSLKEGVYTLQVSFVGAAKQEKQVAVVSGQTAEVSFVLDQSALELSEITVIDNRINAFYRDSSVIVAKMPLKDLDNPQVYNSISKEVLNNQVVTNFNDALKNATGVSRLWESTGRGGDGGEFYSLRGFAVQPSMVNGLPSVNNGGLDPANVETIDVIKGPSGTLFGSPMISYGGLINVTTKRPYETKGGEFRFVSGSNALNRFTADVNVPLNDKVFFRVNTAYHYENSFQDAGFKKSFFIAPSFKVKATDKLTFLINAELNNAEAANPSMVFLSRYAPLSFSDMDLFEKHYKRSFTSNDLTIKNPTFGLQAQALYKLSDTWTSQTVLSRSTAKTDGYYHYLWDQSDGNTFLRYISYRNGETNTTDIQQNFISTFNIAGKENKLLIGFDYFESAIQNGSSDWEEGGFVTLEDGVDTGILNRASVDSLFTGSSEGNSTGKSKVLSAYVSDIVKLLPSLSIMASVRVDRFSGLTAYWAEHEVKEQVSISPKFGVVYQPVKDKVSVFGNYMNGFINVAPTLVSGQLKAFDPEQANQVEFGVKSNLMNGKVSATASYYNIRVKNRVMNDPTNPVQGGEVESKGFEVSVIANPINGLNVIAGFSDNSSEVIKDFPAEGYLGYRPEEAGPEQLANLWINYTFKGGVLNGLGLGFGGNYASENKALNRGTTGTFTLPSYTIFNASLSYTGTQYGIIVKVNNLADQKYYSGWSTVTPQNLRNVSLSLNYKF